MVPSSMMAKNSCRHSSISIEATAAPSASERGASRKTGQPVLTLRSVRLLVRTPTVMTGMPASLRIGIAASIDSVQRKPTTRLTLAATKSLRRLGAAFGRALIVDDVERGGRGCRRCRRFGAGTDLRAEPRRRAGQRRGNADQQPVGLRAAEQPAPAPRNRGAHAKPASGATWSRQRAWRAGKSSTAEVKAADCIGNTRFGALPPPGLWRAGLVPYKARQGISGNCPQC